MSLQTLDRTQWSYAEALAHVQNVMVARRATEAARLPKRLRPRMANGDRHKTLWKNGNLRRKKSCSWRCGTETCLRKVASPRPELVGLRVLKAVSVCILDTTPAFVLSNGERGSILRTMIDLRHATGSSSRPACRAFL